LTGPITVSGKRYASPEIQPTMAPLAVLNNPDIAAVLTYIRREWNNTGAPISERAVNHHRIKAQGRTVPWTEAELKAFAKDAAK
jgi:mono/diheme cytochrome c family protein